MYSVIDKQTDSRSYGWLGVEKSDITLTLVEMAPDQFGINFDASWKGLVSGHATDGPFQVKGNQDTIVHQNPTIRVEISDWSVDQASRRISGHYRIHVDLSAYKLGTVLVYEKVLAGNFGAQSPSQMMEAFARALETA
ncbi:hypothetical protein [Rhodobacter lacus]|uniref:Uncharacterized protein n=1 Tax=Rhodobacter lacus TaxID=1641972 RepID=A0ABW5A520_9RHOB